MVSTRRKAGLRVAALAGLALAAAPVGLAARSDAGARGGDPARGAAVFLHAGCGDCHAVSSLGTAGDLGPPLDGLAVPAETAITFVMHGSLHMPAFGGILSRRQIEDVAAFVDAVGLNEAVDLLPDLDPGSPASVTGARTGAADGRRAVLRLTAALENTGPGPLVLRRAGAPAAGVLPAAQAVVSSDATSRLLPPTAHLVQEWPGDWEAAELASVELRRAGRPTPLRRATVSACLADLVRGHDVSTAPATPVFGRACGRGDREPGALEMGLSSGWRVRVAAELDVRGLAAGRYVVALRADPGGILTEAGWAPRASSALVGLSWPRGRDAAPRLRLLRRCADRVGC